MKTIKLRIIQEHDPKGILVEKRKGHSALYRYLYVHYDELSKLSMTSNRIHKIQKKFGVGSWEYHSIDIFVTGAKDAEKKLNEKREEEIKTLTKEVEKGFSSVSGQKLKPSVIHKKKLRIDRLKNQIESKPAFGGKANFRELTKEYNKKPDERDYEKIERLTQVIHDNRTDNFWIVGEAPRHGNRFFDFSQIGEEKVIFLYGNGKGQKPEEILIDVKYPNRFKEELVKMSELANDCLIPVMVQINGDEMLLTFDEAAIKGYMIDVKAKQKEVNVLNKRASAGEISNDEKKTLKHEIDLRYENELTKLMLVGKIESRCMALDLNPTNIGYSILDRMLDGTIKVVEAGWIDLTELTKRLGVSSDDPKQLHQNNKRKYELSIIIRELIERAMHYKCGSFVIEDLDGIKGKNEASKEANRKINNIWGREYIKNLISKHCGMRGIELIKIQPQYTSFIGNILHPYVDATNASIEIGRRGLYRYDIEKKYPSLGEQELGTMITKFGGSFRLGGDALGKEYPKTWKDMYNVLILCCAIEDSDNGKKKKLKKKLSTAERYKAKRLLNAKIRAALEDLPPKSYQCHSMNSQKSNVKWVIFNKVC